MNEWFNVHLPVPPFWTRGWPRDAVAWFGDDAGECLAFVWELVALLREHGKAVRLLRSRGPGKILYEDDLQIVVKEWRHL